VLSTRIAEWERLLEDYRRSDAESLLDAISDGFDELSPAPVK